MLALGELTSENIKEVITSLIFNGFKVIKKVELSQTSIPDGSVSINSGMCLQDGNIINIKNPQVVNILTNKGGWGEPLPADSTYDRIDLICIKYATKETNVKTKWFIDDSGETIMEYPENVATRVEDYFDIEVIHGTPSSSPVKPDIPEGYEEVAEIYVEKNVTEILNENITNKLNIETFPIKAIKSEEEPTYDEDGILWYKPSADETKVFFNGEFRDLGGLPPIESENMPSGQIKEGQIWYKPSTEETKIFLDGEFRDIGGGGALYEESNRVVLDSDTDIVSIGIYGFDKEKDILFVIMDTTTLNKGEHYAFNTAGTHIVKLGGGYWEEGTVFHFRSLSPMKQITSDKSILKLTEIYSFYIAENDEETDIPINNSNFNPELDVLRVIHKGLELIKDVEYEIAEDGALISLLDWSLNTGERIDFFVKKNVKTNIHDDEFDGSLSIDRSIPKRKLALDLQNEINSGVEAKNLIDSHLLEKIWGAM